MNKGNTFKWIALYVAIAGAGYYVLTHSKKHYANIILRFGEAGGGLHALMQLDKPYLAAWAKASKLGAASFAFGGKTYNTKGGKAI